MRIGTLNMVLTLFLVHILYVEGAVRLPSILGSNAVLQNNFENGNRAQLWGWASRPGELVTALVMPNNLTLQVPAGNDLVWRMQVLGSQVGRSGNPLNFTFSGEDGTPVDIYNVVFGDVFVCIGDQSSMGSPMKYEKPERLILQPSAPIRLFQVLPNSTTSNTPANQVEGSWIEVNQDNVAEVSTLCYVASTMTSAKHFHSAVGMIVGTPPVDMPMSAWSPPVALSACNQKDSWDVQDSSVYNAIIHPLAFLHFRSMIMAHGVADAVKLSQSNHENLANNEYACLLTASVNAWRDEFGYGDWPIVLTELGGSILNATERGVTHIRQQQQMCLPSDSIQTTGLAMAADTFGNNTEVGLRLADEVLITSVGFTCKGYTPSAIFNCAPTAISITREIGNDNNLNLTFAQLGGFINITMKCMTPSALEEMVNGQWTSVNASISPIGTRSYRIEGVSMGATSIRYGYSMNVSCPLINSDNIPVMQFNLNITKDEEVDSTSRLRVPNYSWDHELYNFHMKSPPNFTIDKTIAPVPPLGWETWNAVHATFGERNIKQIGTAMLASGMKAAGYQFLVFDEWSAKERGFNDELLADPRRFPNGASELCSYIHSIGLKCGIYTTCGTDTCQKRAGSAGHATQDAQTFASYGADYVFVDACGDEQFYQEFAIATNATGRRIVIEAHGPHPPGGAYIEKYAHLWRTAGDIQFDWKSIVDAVIAENDLVDFNQPGNFNYADMLEVGDAGLSYEEQKSHFILWSILASPLMAGNMINTMNNATRDILTASEVLSVNQDKLCKQGVLVKSSKPPSPPNPEIRPLDIQSCSLVTDNFQWSVNENDHSIRNVGTGDCLTVHSCSHSSGAGIILFPCVLKSGGCPKNQMWTRSKTGMITNSLSGLCVQYERGECNSTLSQPCADQQRCSNANPKQVWVYNEENQTLSVVVNGTTQCLYTPPQAVQANTKNTIVTTPDAVWAKNLSNGSIAIALVNMQDGNGSVSVAWSDIGFESNTKLFVRDLWRQQSLGTFAEGFETPVLPRHDTILIRVEHVQTFLS
eukprot:m.11653 g.11653  ORF g.11653 m.11653 type:complete len:1041 (+) comp4500_c0_seq1:280-3402(+)